MDLLAELQDELKTEYTITKKFIALYPEARNDWKPHEKSGSFLWLTRHLTDIFRWPQIIMDTDYLDFENPSIKNPEAATRDELDAYLDTCYAKSREALAKLKMGDLDGRWDIRQGDKVFIEWSKYGAIRHAFKQITHHRAQLGVYYRLNDIPVPGSYGPSADEAY